MYRVRVLIKFALAIIPGIIAAMHPNAVVESNCASSILPTACCVGTEDPTKVCTLHVCAVDASAHKEFLQPTKVNTIVVSYTALFRKCLYRTTELTLARSAMGQLLDERGKYHQARTRDS